MKIFKSAFRWLIAAGSLVGFFGGWILLAHSPKPIPFVTSGQPSTNTSSSNLQPLPTLPPIPSLQQQLNQPQRSPSFSLPSPSFSAMPRMITRGS